MWKKTVITIMNMVKPMWEKLTIICKKLFEQVVQMVKNYYDENNESKALNQQLRLLSRASVLEEGRLPHHFRNVMITIASCLTIIIIWASIATVKEIAKTTGEIVPTGYIQQIQHLEGGVVSKLLVSEGQLVNKKQPLITIAGDSVRGELDKAETKGGTLRLQAERYRSFTNLKPSEFEKVSKDLLSLESDQRKILESMIENRDRQKKVIQEQLNQRKEALEQAQSKLETLKKNLKLAKEVFETKNNLLKKGNAIKTTVIEAEKEVNSIEGEIVKTTSEIEQSEQGIVEFETRLKSLESSLRDEALQKLSLIESDIAENKTVIEKLKSQIERLEIVSPVKGIVKGLEATTIGGVVSPGQKIMEIVPIEEVLVAEVKINPTDIGNLRVGQSCVVKISAFDFSRYGAIDGKLSSISATTFTTKEGVSYYRARIELSKNYVGNNPEHNVVLPGMMVNADIVTGEKTIIGYLIKPIQVALSTALTEK